MKLTDEQKYLDKTAIDEMLKLGVKGAAWDSGHCRGDQICTLTGLKVFVYTINEIPKVQELIALGVDGIITDNPALVWKAIATR